MPMPRHYQATLRWTRTNAAAACILYYAPEAAQEEPELETIPLVAQAINAHLAAACKAVVNTTTKFEGVDVVYSSSDVRWEASSVPVVTAGDVMGDCFPEDVAVCIQRRTGLPGRGRSGRIFLPFVPEGFALDSALTTVALDAYKELASLMATPIADPEESGIPILFPRQPIFKTSALHTVIACRVLDNTVSRKDRRDPKRARPVFANPNAGG